MKNNYLIAICCLLLAFNVVAQDLDMDDVVKSEEDVQSFEDYLVFLAWQNSPTTKQYAYREEIAGIEVKEARLGILESFMPFVNYSFGNSQGFQLDNNGVPVSDIPISDGDSRGIGFGMSIRLLPLFATKHEVAKAKANARLIQLDADNGRLSVRSAVLGRYYNYIYGQKSVEERLKTEAETEENWRLVLELFKKELAEFEEVNAASMTYHKAVEDRQSAELGVRIAQLELEELIGVSLEEAKDVYFEEEDDE